MREKIEQIRDLLDEIEEELENKSTEDLVEKFKEFLSGKREPEKIEQVEKPKRGRPRKKKEPKGDPFAGMEDTSLPGYDKINDNVERVTRRPPYKPVTRTCLGCSKTFELPPQLVTNNYKCDRCVRGL